MKKKAAVCFFGQARTLPLCFPYIKKNLLEPLGKPRKDYDIFCCVEDDEDARHINLLRPTEVLKIKSDEVEKIFKKESAFLDKHNYKKYLCRIDSKTPNPFTNMFHQIYKKKLCFNLLEKHMDREKNHYRYFIRTRFDLLPVDEIPLKKIAHNEVAIPKNSFIKSRNGVDDCFCITSDLETFRIYCNVIDHLRDLIMKYHTMHFSFSQKLFLSFEKRYKRLLISILRNSKNFPVLFELFTLPLGLMFKSFRNKIFGNHQLLLEHLTENNRKVKEFPLAYALMRKDHTGTLEVDR